MSTREPRRAGLSLKSTKAKPDRRSSPRSLRTKTPSVNELRKKYKESPKGKRKLHFSTKGPLAGKSFYLDLRGYRHLPQIKKAIKQLSGVVEEFFHKDVNYLVTNRINADNGKSPSSQSAPSPATPSPLHISQSSSVKSCAVPSPLSTDSPQGMDHRQTKATLNTRGQAMCNIVSGGLKKGTTDVLSNAHTWGVNVFHVERVMKWLGKLVTTREAKAEAAARSPSKLQRSIQGKVPKVVAMQDSYLKVEDLTFKYRPLVHEFKSWPELTFDGSVICPFDPSRRRSGETNASREKEKIDFKRIAVQRSHHGYCECCEVRYTDLGTHLKGEQHRKFAKTESNYTSLDKAINSGQNIHEFIKEIRCKKSVRDNESKIIDGSARSQEMTCDVLLLSSPEAISKQEHKNHSKEVPRDNPREETTEKSSLAESCNVHGGLKMGKNVKDKSSFLQDASSVGKSEEAPQSLSDDVKIEIEENWSMSGECSVADDCEAKSEQASCGSPTKDDKIGGTLECFLVPINLNKMSPQPSAPCSPEHIMENENKKSARRSSSSRRKRHGSLQLSPIYPSSNATARSRRSLASSCSVNDKLLPSGPSVYSSLGSSASFEDVSRDVDCLVSRIETNSDFTGENSDTKDLRLIESVTKTPPKRHVSLCPGSAYLESWCVKDSSVDVKNDPAEIKRKRSPNDEDGRPSRARKCKRLHGVSESLTSNNDIGSDTIIDNDYTEGIDDIEDDCFRSSVAERVKIQRALFESMQDHYLPSNADTPASPSSPPSQTKPRRSHRDILITSPFAELTNKCTSYRGRAKSESCKITSRARTKQWGEKYHSSKVPRSACLTPNDPFSFHDS